MPPKADKVKAKIVEDKTFGLKNKNKSKRVQQYVKAVEINASIAGKTREQLKQEEAKRKLKEQAKDLKAAAAEEAKLLGLPVINSQQVAAGVDPKSVVCEFYKKGNCIRGNKCKFSHDMALERKVAKIDLYSDMRDEKEKDTMDNWDQAKLEEIVNKKAAGRPCETEIVCKYFLDAIVQYKYGWLWKCPNGETCHYKHKLPPGFVLKRPADKKKELEDAANAPTIEEQIEAERAQLDLAKCTMVTPETFAKWKADRLKAKADAVETMRKEANKKKGNNGLHILSGKALFQFDPSLFVDDDDAAGGDELEIQDSDAEDNESGAAESAAAGAPAADKAKEWGSGEQATEDAEALQAVRDAVASGEFNNAAAGALDADLFLDDEQLPDDDEDAADE